MIQSFDHIARDYDQLYTYSQIGKLQRSHVYSYISKNILAKRKLNILEINCGTGEDAIYLAKLGHRILATDASNEMIKVANLKAKQDNSANVTFRQLSFGEIRNLNSDEKYDLIFSNFGGLNSISEEELKQLFQDTTDLLKPGGRFVGVLMPRFYLWEMLYFLLKLKWKLMFRRHSKRPVLLNLNDIPYKTWYYTPYQIKSISKGYKIIHFKAIGIALPPLYTENFFKGKFYIVNFLNRIENIFNRFPFFARFSDHFLFDLQLNKN
jgi:ubiquinone/menaquinone biosynthesis C-methylase UbiE